MFKVVVSGVLSVLFCLGGTAWAAQDTPFDQWLTALKKEAQQKGISVKTLEKAFKGVKPVPRVIELDRKQPELVLTLDEYLSRVVPKRRIKQGRKKLAENRKLLNEISGRYGVQPEFLVAFWGIETDFGRLSGGFSVISALATLAYEGRRGAFFRRQLMDALQILEEGHVGPEQMKGSWAGAMGQTQFMPSTFRAYAVDYDGDGRIDLWNSKADVFASAANYLSKVGWDAGHTWGEEVKIGNNIDDGQISLDVKKKVTNWKSLGVSSLADSGSFQYDLDASLIRPDEKPGARSFLVYNNFRAIMHWNRSQKFAIAVGTLSDHIAK